MTDYVDRIAEARALVRAAGTTIVRVRMHPDDIADLRERYLRDSDADADAFMRVFGIPVLSDDSQEPGTPEVEYAGWD